MAREFIDYYLVLGVSKNATLDEINKKYRELSRKYHPDISEEEDAEEKYQAINEAYSILGNAEKRRDYDLNYNYLKNKQNSSDNHSSSKSARDYTEDEIRKLRIIKIKKQVIIALERASKLLEEKNKFEESACLKEYSKEDYEETVKYLKTANKTISDYLKKLYKVVDSYNLAEEKKVIGKTIFKLQENNKFVSYEKFVFLFTLKIISNIMDAGNNLYEQKERLKKLVSNSNISRDDYDRKRNDLLTKEKDILKKIDLIIKRKLSSSQTYEISELKSKLNENYILNYSYEEAREKYYVNYAGEILLKEALDLLHIHVEYNKLYNMIKEVDEHTLVKEIDTKYLNELVLKMGEFYKKVDDKIKICFSYGSKFDTPPAVSSGVISRRHSDVDTALDLLKNLSLTYNYDYFYHVDLTKAAKERYNNLLRILDILKKRDEMTQNILNVSGNILKIDEFYIDVFKGKISDINYIRNLREVLKEVSKIRKEVDILHEQSEFYQIYLNESENKSYDIIKMLYANLEYKLDVYPNDFSEAKALGGVLNAYKEDDNFKRAASFYIKDYDKSFTSIEILKMLNINSGIFNEFRENIPKLVRKSYSIAIFNKKKREDYLKDYLYVYPDMVKRFDYDRFEGMISTARNEGFNRDTSDLWNENNYSNKRFTDLKEMFKKSH